MSVSDTIAIPIKRTPVKQFDIYVIDTGWNDAMSEVLKKHLKLFETYLLDRNNCYVLDEQRSTEILRANPDLIGKDPILVVVDTDAMVEKRRSGHGFRCCLGLVKSLVQAEELLTDLLQIILDTQKSKHINAAVRKEIHKAGFEGAMEILGESLTTLRGE